MGCDAELALPAPFPVQAWLAKLELVGPQQATGPAAVAFEIAAEAEQVVWSARAELSAQAELPAG
jgi:hypothetical protein